MAWRSFASLYLLHTAVLICVSLGVVPLVLSNAHALNQCTVHKATDYGGSNLKSIQGLTGEQCCNACWDFKCCAVGIMFGGTCYLKQSTADPKNNSGAISYVVSRKPPIPPKPVPPPKCPTWYERTKNGPRFRNVMDYGAKGDGVTNDFVAIQRALTEDRTSTWGHPNSSDSTVVYFPPGTYMINDTLSSYMFTQMIGNYKCRPKIKMMPCTAAGDRKFLVQATNTYEGEHVSNFYHSINNIDLDLGEDNIQACGIHWAVAQATVLRNMTINVSSGQSGIWVENGGGGTIADVEVIGGQTGIFIGGQQWTFRNVYIHGAAQIGIDINWNWVFTFISCHFTDMRVGMVVRKGAGSVVLLDTTFDSLFLGISSDFPLLLPALLIDGLHATNTTYLIDGMTGGSGSSSLELWYQGHAWNKASPIPALQGKPKSNRADNAVPTNCALDTFDQGPEIYNAYDAGATGDGKTDDTAALQKALNTHSRVFLPQGTYLLSDTLTIPSGRSLFGEAWSVIQLKNHSKGFDDPTKPKSLIVVPQGATHVQFWNLVFETQGNASGCIFVQWGADYTSSWHDVHYRMYYKVHTLLSLQHSAGGYFENVWLWIADHNIDTGLRKNVSNPYGLQLSSTGPTWLVGFASEHNRIANFNISHASNVFAFLLQTESPYWQDPATAWMMNIESSSNVSIWGSVGENWFNGNQSAFNRIQDCDNCRLYSLNTRSSDVSAYAPGCVMLTGTWKIPTRNDTGFCSNVVVDF